MGAAIAVHLTNAALRAIKTGSCFSALWRQRWKNAKRMVFMANAFKAVRDATEQGDTREGVLPVGQETGLIHDEPTIAELLERFIAEVRTIQQQLSVNMA